MVNIEIEIDRLKNIYLEMLNLVKGQMKLAKDAIIKGNVDAAKEVLQRERRVNEYEITIDRECENILALQSPVAVDLRFTISILKMSGCLERIGDHAYSISELVYNDKAEFPDDLMKLAGIEDLFDEVDLMIHNAKKSFIEKDVELVQKIFAQDKNINKINKSIPKLLKHYYKENPKTDFISLLQIFRIVGRMERSGDMLQNIGEEIIFYIESDIIKHQKKNKRIRKRFSDKETKDKKK